MISVAPPCHRPRRIREIFRCFRQVVRRFRREWRAKSSRNLDRVGAIVLVKKSSKSELSSRFLCRLKFFVRSPSFFGRRPLVAMVLTNFCVPRGPRFGGAVQRGPPRHAKIDLIFCSHGPFTKIFLKRKPRENLAKTLRKLRENLAKASRKPRENLAKTLGCRKLGTINREGL